MIGEKTMRIQISRADLRNYMYENCSMTLNPHSSQPKSQPDCNYNITATKCDRPSNRLFNEKTTFDNLKS